MSTRNRWRDVYVRTSHVESNRTKDLKEAMADSACIEAMQEDIHHVDDKLVQLVRDQENKTCTSMSCRRSRLADLFTKALSEDRLKYLIRRLGMRCLTPDEQKVLANKSA
ncbi:hypothetical protein Tco_0512033 [Tanacetum coccineum]